MKSMLLTLIGLIAILTLNSGCDEKTTTMAYSVLTITPINLPSGGLQCHPDNPYCPPTRITKFKPYNPTRQLRIVGWECHPDNPNCP